jgi:hypothetical protein
MLPLRGECQPISMLFEIHPDMILAKEHFDFLNA